MPTRQSPTLRRRRLAQELRRLREAANLTSAEVTKRLEWSTGKLTRMERNEGKRYDPHDVRLLCDVYGTDERTREVLVQLARDGRLKGWWDPYGSMLSETYTTYIGLETEAAAIFAYQPLIIPGLLQTDEYARSIALAGPAELDENGVEQRVQIRRERQAILSGSDPTRLWAVIDEAALRRAGGGPEVMRAQLAHLGTMARSARITLQVIPFSAGMHAGVTGGSFTILQFPEDIDQDAVYVDTFAGELFVEEPEQVGRFHNAFRHLVGAALSPVDTLALIAEEATRVEPTQRGMCAHDPQ